MLHGNRHRRWVIKWDAVGQHLEQHDTERVDVTLGDSLRRIDGLLRRDIMGAAKGIADCAFGYAQRQSEIRQYGFTAARDHDVRWLNITVDDSLAVSIIEGCADVAHDIPNFGS